MAKRVKVGPGLLISPVKRKPSPRVRGRKVRTLNARTAGFLGIERKFVDYQTVNDAFTTSWATMEDATAKSISAVAVGNTESTRVGRVYHITSVHLRGAVICAAQESDTAPFSDSLCRIVIVHDTQTNAADVTAADIMDEGQTDNHFAFRNLQNTKRFRILMDKTIVLRYDNMTNEGGANLFAVGPRVTQWKFNRTFKKPIKVICKGASAVIASITDNSIHVIGITSSVATAAALSYQSRIRFTG